MGQVEGVPKDLDRALLAAEPTGEFLEHVLGEEQCPMEALDVVGVVGAVALVVGEGLVGDRGWRVLLPGGGLACRACPK